MRNGGVVVALAASCLLLVAICAVLRLPHDRVELMARSKFRWSLHLLNKPRHYKFSSKPTGGRHISTHQAESFSHKLLNTPRQRSLTADKLPSGNNLQWWKAKSGEGSGVSAAVHRDMTPARSVFSCFMRVVGLSMSRILLCLFARQLIAPAREAF